MTIYLHELTPAQQWFLCSYTPEGPQGNCPGSVTAAMDELETLGITDGEGQLTFEGHELVWSGRAEIENQ